jgi:hypothetical protein
MAQSASKIVALAATAAILAVTACKTAQAPAPATASGTPATGSGTPATGSGSGSGGGTTIPTLVSVNLQNVLNNLSVQLHVNRDNIPVNAQVPIAVAASVCGVSVDALAASAANGQASCTATTATPQLTQAVQQQIASGGAVTGGPQNMGSPAGPTTNNMM